MYQKSCLKNKLKHKSYILGDYFQYICLTKGMIFSLKSPEKWTEHMNKYLTQDTMADNKPNHKIYKDI